MKNSGGRFPNQSFGSFANLGHTGEGVGSKGPKKVFFWGGDPHRELIGNKIDLVGPGGEFCRPLMEMFPSHPENNLPPRFAGWPRKARALVKWEKRPPPRKNEIFVPRTMENS